MAKKPIVSGLKSDKVGIPDPRTWRGKLTTEVFAKVTTSVANYVKARGGSEYIRGLILKDMDECLTKECADNLGELGEKLEQMETA